MAGSIKAQNFLNDPKLNEHKIIGAKFQRRQFKSLAVELYQNKLQNNPMRSNAEVSRLATALSNKQSVATEKENMPSISLNMGNKYVIKS